jgi:hypothetical protein
MKPMSYVKHYTQENTPGYSDDGLAALNRAHEIIVREHGYDMDGLPAAVSAEITQSLRDRLTNTHGKNLSVRMLLALTA